MNDHKYTKWENLELTAQDLYENSHLKALASEVVGTILEHCHNNSGTGPYLSSFDDKHQSVAMNLVLNGLFRYIEHGDEKEIVPSIS